MAGHSKWHNIKHRKAAQDAKKSKVYAQVAKLIQMAAKQGDDPSLNPALDTVLIKARQVGLPKEVIQKAIDKGAGNDTGEELVEIFYEGYGPGGVAMYIKCITSNTNRSGAGVKAILAKYGGNMGEPGSVARQFQEKGEIYITGKILEETKKGKYHKSILPIDNDTLEELIMTTSALDYDFEDGAARVLTTREDFIGLVKFFESAGWHIENAEIAYIADTTIELDGSGDEKLQTIINYLDDHEDVDTVWHNAA